MKIFISHKFTGINKVTLRKKIESLVFFLEKRNHKTFNYFYNKKKWDEKNFSPKKSIKEVFREIKKSDALLVFVDQKEKSEEMLIEVGFAKALNKKIILLISKKIKTFFLEAIADKIIKFNNFQEIEKKLKFKK